MAVQHGAQNNNPAPHGAQGFARGSVLGSRAFSEIFSGQCQGHVSRIHHRHLSQSTFRASLQHNKALTADAASGAA